MIYRKRKFKKNVSAIIPLIVVLLIILFVVWIGGQKISSETEIAESGTNKEVVQEEEKSFIEKIFLPKNDEKNEVSESIDQEDVLLDIPFTPQAPFGDWDDPRQQDGCEEASVLMAMRWAQGKDLTYSEAENEILAISEFEVDKYGSFHDTSAKDTIKRIIKGYFNYDKTELKENATIEDIKDELYKGNAIIIPADGRKLGNPYFTSPGPEYHMLVIRGYDVSAKEFITNDPGTKRGKGYRYSENTLYNAFRDYPTGYHEPVIKIEKTMIIIKQ